MENFLNHFSSIFLSAVVEQTRLTLQKEHQLEAETSTDLKVEINKVQSTLASQRHQPELTGVYIMLTVALVVNFLICFGMTLLRNSIVNWMVRHQLRHAQSRGVAEVSLLHNPGSSEV